MESWMKNLPDDLKKLPLNNICIPGSHDTGAYQLHTELPLAHDQRFSIFLRGLSKLKTVRNIIRRWSETQEHNIIQQLNMGIRYLDLRLELAAYRDYEINPYLVHALFGEENPSFMKEIKNFLDENKEEIIIIDVNHLYEMNELDFVQFFVRPIEQIFGRDAFCPVMVDVARSSIEELVETNHRLIVVGPYDHDVKGIIFANCAVKSKWPNVSKARDLIDFMEREIDAPDRTNFHVLQGVMTAKASLIGAHLLSSLKKQLSLKSLAATIDFVNNMKPKQVDNLNIVITDQVNENFTKAVVAQNLNKITP